MAESTAQDKAAKPQLGEQTPAQGGWAAGTLGPIGAHPLFVDGLLMGGGTFENPLSFPGYGYPYYGTYNTYRLMLNHPTIRLARSIVTSPVKASTWYYEVGRGDPSNERVKAAMTLVTRVFDQLRSQYTSHGLRAIDFGKADFEPIWEIDEDGLVVVSRLKPLRVDFTSPKVDEHGNLIALVNGGKELLVKKGKALSFVFDGEADDHFGRSTLEDLRDTAWKDWLDAASQLQMVANNISGRQAYAIVPAGGYIEGDGKFRSYAQDAADALLAIRQGKNPVLTSPSAAPLAGGNIKDFEAVKTAAYVTLQMIDFGSTAPAIGGLLDRLRHNEELMFQGLLLPSRVGQEGEHGTNAESQTMTETAIVNSQLLGDDLAACIQPLVDRMLSVNYGLPMGTIRVRQSPLVDARRATFKQIITSIMSDPKCRATFVRVADMDKVVDGIDVPRDGEWDEAEKEIETKAKEAQAEANRQAAALADAKPPINGAVNGNSRLKELAGKGQEEN